VSNFKIIPLIGKISRLEEMLDKYQLAEDEKECVKKLLVKYKKEKRQLEKNA